MLAAGLIAVLLVLWFYPRKVDNESLFRTYYQVYAAEPTWRHSDSTRLTEGVRYYQQGDFEAAIIAFENLDSSLRQDPKVLLWLGNAYLNQAKYEQAIAAFSSVSKQNKVILSQHGKWYLALTYLKVNQTQAAVTTLNEIAQVAGIYQDQAEELINKLKK